MLSKNTFILLLIFVSISFITSVEFGHFDLLIRKFEACPGPKRKDCAVSSYKLLEENGNLVDIALSVKEFVKINKGKIVVSTKGKETLRLQIKNPCDHLFLKPLFQTMLNVTEDCLILKGDYHYKVDIADIAKKYYGGEFLFGNWTFKSVFYNDNCNFSCAVTSVEILPKKT